jgi:hypothetical protein
MFRKHLSLGLAAAALFIAGTAPAQDFHSPAITLTQAQDVRLNLVNLNEGSADGSVVPAPCHLQVSFLDGAGKPIGAPKTFDLMPGEAVTTGGAYSGDGSRGALIGLLRKGQVSHARAVVSNIAAADGSVAPAPCQAGISFELFSGRNGDTMLLVPAVLTLLPAVQRGG